MSRDAALVSIALDAAVKVSIDAGKNTSADVLATAEAFYSFLTGTTNPPATSTAKVSSPKPVEQKTEIIGEKAKPAATKAKPAATKTPPKEEPVEETTEETAAEEPQVDEEDGPSDMDRVKAVVKQLLDADQRQAAQDLLKKYKAASSSALVEKGTAVVNKFVNEAEELLLAA